MIVSEQLSHHDHQIPLRMLLLAFIDFFVEMAKKLSLDLELSIHLKLSIHLNSCLTLMAENNFVGAAVSP